MKWLETSLVIERVAAHKVATLFEQFENNGFVEEDIDEKLLTFIFYREIKEELYETSLRTLIENIETKLKKNRIEIHGPIKVEIIKEEEWLTGWKKYANPIELLPNFVLVPQWNTYEILPGKIVNYYNLDLTFGTGAHATTISCAKLIALYGKKSDSILDVGTGTGVLLLVSHYVNANAELFGIDIDPQSVEQAIDNCFLNHVNATIIEGDLITDFKRECNLVIANLTVDPLKILLGQIRHILQKDGILIISGIIDERYEELWPYIEKEWLILEHIRLENWNTLALKYRG